MSPTTAVAEFSVRPNPDPHSDEARQRALEELDFGRAFTDHMVRISWAAGEGWTDRRVEPYGTITLDPAATVLHYGQGIFEGLKAYRWDDGSIWLFRPEDNAARMQASARRMALPELSTQDFIGSVEALLSVDAEWVPRGADASLYLRPFMFASEAYLGVRPGHKVSYVLIASPVGPYFAGGVDAVSIWVAQGYHRASAGGTGAAKCGGNYAASMLPQVQARQHGCEQVLYTDAATETLLEEFGGMNALVVRADGIVETPRLTGDILEGITRASILQLLEDDGVRAVEKDITLADVAEGARDGDIAELFACGTAAVVAPVGRLASPDFDVTVGDGSAGPVTRGILERLTDIQYGRAEDTHGWMRRVG